MIVGGEDSSKGLFVTEVEDEFEEPEIGTMLLDESSPILYVAPATIEDTLMRAQVIASAWEIIWGKKGEIKGPKKAVPGIQSVASQGKVIVKEAKPVPDRAPRRVQSSALEGVIKAMSSWCPISEVVVKNQEPSFEIVQVMPPEHILEINAQPMMPSLAVKAELRNSNWNDQIDYSWQITMNWKDRWKNEWPKLYHRDATTEDHEDEWTVDWGNVFIGGDQISVEATADVAGRVFPAEPVRNKFKILGRNPSKEQAIAELDTFQRVIMFKESGYRQFDAPIGGLGLPLVGATTADYGIMQVNYTNHLTLNQLWSWRENKQRGLDLLNDAKTHALAWPAAIRSGKVGRKYKVDVSDACFRSCPDHFDTDEEILKETYARYNGPSTRTHYWFWVPDDFKNPSAGGTWYKENDGNSGAYADEAWAMFDRVSNGNAPSGW
jgi:hypothetical protein